MTGFWMTGCWITGLWIIGAIDPRLRPLDGWPVKALPAVDQIGDGPAHQENADDEITEIGEPAVQPVDQVPEAAGKSELIGDEAERFDAADQHSDQDRNSGDGEVVPNLADRIEVRPAIGADHQHAVGGIDQ